MKATQILVGETYALTTYRTTRYLPFATRVRVLAAPAHGKVRVVAADRADAEPYVTTTRKVYSTWSDYEAAKLEEAVREENAAAARAERKAAYDAERAELLNLLGDHGVAVDAFAIQKRYDGRPAVALTLEEVRALLAARPLAYHFPDAEVPLPGDCPTPRVQWGTPRKHDTY